MIYNFDAKILDLQGEEITDSITKEPVILKQLAINSLTADDKQKSGNDKIKDFNIALKISGGGEVELNLDESKRVLDLIKKFMPTLLAGRAAQILDK